MTVGNKIDFFNFNDILTYIYLMTHTYTHTHDHKTKVRLNEFLICNWSLIWLMMVRTQVPNLKKIEVVGFICKAEFYSNL